MTLGDAWARGNSPAISRATASSLLPDGGFQSQNGQREGGLPLCEGIGASVEKEETNEKR
jgi:hypothetical protein